MRTRTELARNGSLPTPALELLIRERGEQQQEQAIREQEPDGRPELGEHAEPALAAGRRIFRGQQCRAAPLAAEAYSLAEAEQAKDCRGSHAKGFISGQKPDRNR
jgi:hypothetical protein